MGAGPDGTQRLLNFYTWDTDGHVSRRWFRDTIGKPVLAAAGITRRLRIHDLRHAHACWLLAGGADVQTARERLGHAGVGVGCAVIVPELSRSTQ